MTLDTVGDFTYDGESHDLIKELKVSPEVDDYKVKYKLTYINNFGEPKEINTEKAEDVKATDAGKYVITATVQAEGYPEAKAEAIVTVAKADWAITFTEDADNGKEIEAGSTIEGTVSDGSCVKTVYLKQKYKEKDISFSIEAEDSVGEDKQPEILYVEGTGALQITFKAEGGYTLTVTPNENNFAIPEGSTEQKLNFAIIAEATTTSGIIANNASAFLNQNSEGKCVISIPYEFTEEWKQKKRVSVTAQVTNIEDGTFTAKSVAETDEATGENKLAIELSATDINKLADMIAKAENSLSIQVKIIAARKWFGSTISYTEKTVNVTLTFAPYEGKIEEDFEIIGGVKGDNGWYRAPANDEEKELGALAVQVIEKTGEEAKAYTVSLQAAGEYGTSCELLQTEAAVVFVKENGTGNIAKVPLKFNSNDVKADFTAPVTTIEKVANPVNVLKKIWNNITFGAAGADEEDKNGEKKYTVVFGSSDDFALASVHVAVKTTSLENIQAQINAHQAAEPVRTDEKYTDMEAYNAALAAWEADPENVAEPVRSDYVDEEAYAAAHEAWEKEEIFAFDPDATVTYDYTLDELTYDEETESYKTGEITVNTDQVCQIDFWAVDEAGNVESVRHTGNYDEVAGEKYDFLLIDNNAPAITIEVNNQKYDNGAVIFFSKAEGNLNNDITVTATVEDEYYDLICEKYGQLLTVTCPGIVEKPVVDAGEKKVEITIPKEQKDGDYQITASCEDTSGNIGQFGITVIVDNTAPDLSAEHINYPDTAYGKDTDRFYYGIGLDPVFEVVLNDANPKLNEDGTVSIFLDDGKEERISKAGDSYTGKITVEGKEDGEYKFEFSHADMANNKSSAECATYIIDTKVPTVTVNLMAPANMEGATRYYNGPISGTIQIVEKNFAEELINVKVNEGGRKAGFALQDGTEDRYNGSVHITGDGNYKLSVNGKDKAGNSMTGYASDNLVIDTKIEAPVISGVASGKAYTDKNITVTVTGEDTNLEEISVKITRVTKDTSETVFTTSGKDRTVSFSIPDDQSADGIYTVEASIRDKATNKASAVPVTFTVNRYGSVYEFVSGIDEVNGKHVQAVEKDLVIREYSATKLKTPLDSNVQITINGKPVSAAVVNAEEKHENGGWYEYTYTVAASSFAEDGYYKLEVSSTDSENGKVSGTAKYADMGLAFFKDGTKPQLESILGMEKPTYNENEHGIDFNVYDAIGLASVKVYVDGKEVLTQTEFEDANTFNGSLLLNEMSSKQHVRFVVEDLAGNVTDTDDEIEAFAPAYEFVPDITVSTNFFVRWYAQPGLFWGSIGGGAALIALIVFLISRKKKTAKAE